MDPTNRLLILNWQLTTTSFGYCIQVYLRSLLEEKQESGLTLPYATSIRTVSAAQALRRVQRVVALQWRGIFVVIIILTDLVFFATVFLQFDGTTEKTPENIKAGIEWLTCVLNNGGDKNKCLDLTSTLVVPEITALAILFLLSVGSIFHFWINRHISNLWPVAQWYLGSHPSRQLQTFYRMVLFFQRLGRPQKV